MLRAPRMGTEEMDSSNTASSTEQAEAEKFASLYYKRTRADGKKVLWLLYGPELQSLLSAGEKGKTKWLSMETSGSCLQMTYTFSFCSCEDPKPRACGGKSCGERTVTIPKGCRLSENKMKVCQIFNALEWADCDTVVRVARDTPSKPTKWLFILEE
eukprot:GHVP01067928.1.p2 GENE.GHVP01067928.1~~GHVP01067928.1.p2  ORF type:complete len:157 (+),score=18.92 GHVP01067928.1:303-773(+)